MSDFKTKILQHVIFCFNFFFEKSQILNKNLHLKNHVLTEFIQEIGGILHFLCIFINHDCDAKNIFKTQFFEPTFYNVSDFKWLFLQRFRF